MISLCPLNLLIALVIRPRLHWFGFLMIFYCLSIVITKLLLCYWIWVLLSTPLITKCYLTGFQTSLESVMGLWTGLNPTFLTNPSLSLSMVFHQGVRLSRPVYPRVLFLDLFPSHHTRPLYTTVHVAMVYVLTSTRITLNSQLNSRWWLIGCALPALLVLA